MERVKAFAKDWYWVAWLIVLLLAVGYATGKVKVKL